MKLVSTAIYIPHHWCTTDDIGWNTDSFLDLEYCEEKDAWWVPCGWYETITNTIDDIGYVDIDGEVIAWDRMPKPYNPDECMDSKPQTNADIIRSQISTDEGLADFINQLDPNSDNFHYCIESTACDAYLERGELIPEGLCRQCLMEFLQREVEEHEQFT